MTALLFTAAAAAGTTARWWLGLRLPRPYGTLTANLSGSLALGLLHGAEAPALTVIGIGSIGAFTTFSAFAQELIDLWEHRRSTSILYGAVTLSGGVAAAIVGIRLG